MKSPRYVRATDDRRTADVYQSFAAPDGDRRLIQIARPFSVLSRNTYSAAILPPLGLAYLAAVLRQAGYNTGIIDAQGEDIRRIELSECGRYHIQGIGIDQMIDLIDPETAILGVSLMFTQEWLPQRAFIKRAKERYPHLKIVVGGEHPTALPEYVLRDCPEIDYLVSGEGELTFLELCWRIFNRMDTSDTPGVCLIDEQGKFISNGLSARISHLDDLPRPAWDLCKVENYFQPNWAMGIGTGRHMPILATRGCPYQCTFCSNPSMWTTRYKMRDPIDVASEIEELVQNYNVTAVDFFDLTAIVKREWTLDFCNELKRRKVKVTWQLPSGTRSEALDDETLQALYDTGCRLITYAPESGSEETLIRVKKKLNLASITESIRTAKRIGHVIKINLVIGFPDDTLKDTIKTIFYGVKMAFHGTDDCNISVFSPYPGSELYRRLLEEDRLPPPDDDYIYSLIVQFDMTKTNSYCYQVGGKTLAFIRVLGYLAFYLTAYVRYPKRVWRLAKSMFSRAPFKPANVLEQRLYDLCARHMNTSKA